MTSYSFHMPEPEYHAHPALSATGIKALLRCPSRFRHNQLHGRPPKDAFDFGSVVHGLILGTGWEVERWPLEEWRGSWRGETAAQFRARCRAEDKIPIKEVDYRRADDIRIRVLQHPIAWRLLTGRRGVNELSGFWTDPASGVECRFRVDRLTEDEDGTPLVVDLKTTPDASPHAIAQYIAKFGYHIQQEHYLDGMCWSGLDLEAQARMKFVFVETEPPFPVTVTSLTEEAARVGNARVRKAMFLYAECMRSGVWPDYVDDEIVTGLPRWATFQED